MRTTLVIDSTLEPKLRPLAAKKMLSDFVNECLKEHFENEEKAKRMVKLETSYQRAAKNNRKQSEDFETTDIEDWPE